MGQFSGYVLPGSIFIAFGLKWTLQSAKPRHEFIYYHTYQSACRTNSNPPSIAERTRQCCPKSQRFPVEGMVKLAITALGIIISLMVASPKKELQFVGDILYATIYLFFALSGLVDVLAHYCSAAVPDGLDSFTLSLAFIMEGLLFSLNIHHQSHIEQHVHVFLVITMFACAVACLLEVVMSSSHMVRFAKAFFSIIHGTWFIQGGFILHNPHPNKDSEPDDSESSSNAYNDTLLWISLMFAWHCAASFVSMLVVVFSARICKRRSHEMVVLPTCPYCVPEDAILP